MFIALFLIAGCTGTGEDDDDVAGDDDTGDDDTGDDDDQTDDDDSAGDDDTGDDDTGDDDTEDCLGDPEAVFVINTLAIGDVDTGFNLDGTVTPDDCNGDPYCEDGPQDGANGVDNSLGMLVTAFSQFGINVNASIEDALDDASLLLLSRMLSVDDWTTDPCVSSYLYKGHDPSAQPAIEEGRAYEVDATCLGGDGTDIDDPLYAFAGNGDINAGVYLGGPSWLNLNLPVAEFPGGLPLDINDAWIQWNVSPTGLTDGLIGGHLDLFHIYALFAGAADAQYWPMATTLIGPMADIDAIPEGTELLNTACTQQNVDTLDQQLNGCGDAIYTCSAAGHCVEPADHYDSLSVGLTATAIPASISGIYTP